MIFLLGVSFLGSVHGHDSSQDEPGWSLIEGLHPSRTTELVLIIQTWYSLSPQGGSLSATDFSIVINNFPLDVFVHMYLACGARRPGVRQGRRLVKESVT